MRALLWVGHLAVVVIIGTLADVAEVVASWRR